MQARKSCVKSVYIDIEPSVERLAGLDFGPRVVMSFTFRFATMIYV